MMAGGPLEVGRCLGALTPVRRVLAAVIEEMRAAAGYGNDALWSPSRMSAVSAFGDGSQTLWTCDGTGWLKLGRPSAWKGVD
jgi:hypothetical protein